MRGNEAPQVNLFSYVHLEDRVPRRHPLRAMRRIVDHALTGLDGAFAAMYATTGRPSIPPERLLRALLLQICYSIRSEALLIEQLDYNLLFRWFVGLGIDDPVWDPSTFSKNRDRLIEAEVAQGFFDQVLAQAKAKRLLSDEHFSVDGTLIEAWASHKSFQRKDGGSPPSGPGRNGEADFKGERRSNATHQSTTDPEALSYRKSDNQPARLGYLGHVLMENRNGLVVATRLTQATGTAERAAAIAMVEGRPGNQRVTVGADKAYDTADFVKRLRGANATPHVAQNTSNRRSAIDGRTTRHAGYTVSQRIRKRIEECFGWGKVIGPLRKVQVRGVNKVGFVFTLTCAAYNLVRLRNLVGAAP
jgi:transposase